MEEKYYTEAEVNALRNTKEPSKQDKKLAEKFLSNLNNIRKEKKKIFARFYFENGLILTVNRAGQVKIVLMFSGATELNADNFSKFLLELSRKKFTIEEEIED